MKDYKPIWKELAASKFFDGVDVQQYCLLKAMVAKNPDKVGLAVALLQAAFSPIKNPNKLNNGCRPYSALYSLFGKKWPGAQRPLNQCLETLEEKQEYTRIRKAALLILGNELEEYHAFFIIRQDIPAVYQTVQGMHVSLKLGYAIGHDHGIHNLDAGLEHPMQYPDNLNVNNLNFVVCGVKNKEALEGAMEYIHSCGYAVHAFYESDLNNELTAVGSGPIPSYKRRIMKRYKALKFKEN